MAYARIAKNLLDKGAPLHFIGKSDGAEPAAAVRASFSGADIELPVPFRLRISLRRWSDPSGHRRVDEAIHRSWLGGPLDRIGREGFSRP
jgi:hypothetical protein